MCLVHSEIFFLCVHQADPVLVDIMEVCQVVDQETPQEPAEAPTQVRENLYFVFVHQWGLCLCVTVYTVTLWWLAFLDKRQVPTM